MYSKFKDIPGFPGYLVSDTGVVLSQRRGMPRVLKPCVIKNGYQTVNLCRNLKAFRRYIHWLVLLAFVGDKPFPKAVARHLDGKQLNNNLLNLEYGTMKDNQADCVRHGNRPMGGDNWNSKLTENDVIEMLNLIKTGMMQKDIASHYGIGRPHMSSIANGKRWKHITKERVTR